MLKSQLKQKLVRFYSGFGGILKQKLDNKSREELVRFYSGSWNDTQRNYSTVKKEVLSIVLCVKKFEDDLCQEYYFKTDFCKMASFAFEF